MNSHGHKASILLAGEASGKSAHEGDTRQDVPVDVLPGAPDDTWGEKWEALERYLEERAPCYYLMLGSWRGYAVAPRLSNRVQLIYCVRGEAKAEIDQTGLIGHCCEGIVADHERLHLKISSLFPHLAPRLVTIREGGQVPDKVAENYLQLLDQTDHLSRRGGFRRQRAGALQFPALVGERQHTDEDFSYLLESVPWPDAPLAGKFFSARTKSSPAKLTDHKVVVASIPGAISGVDVFSQHLVRGLRGRGIEAILHGRRPAEHATAHSEEVVPFDEFEADKNPDYRGWPNIWRGMISHLESFGPCIYLPNYDYDYSAICPALPGSVRVVGIAHSDDSRHYEHLARIGHGCDALVGISSAITRHLGGLIPQMASRMHTIPYGIPLEEKQSATPRQPRDPAAPLKIIYAGRLVRSQKRAMDIVKIARELDRRGVAFELAVVGDGDLRNEMEQVSLDLIFRQKIWFVLAQPNEGVLSLLPQCDAFLLPSSFEGLSVGMLEAMAQGVVPVVSDIRSGVPDIIKPGENGLIAPVGDFVRFADHLEYLWKNPEQCRRIGQAAQQTVRPGYDVDKMVDRYVELFESILKDPLPRPCGPIAPPLDLQDELLWSTWAWRVAANPMASLRRVSDRVWHGLQ